MNVLVRKLELMFRPTGYTLLKMLSRRIIRIVAITLALFVLTTTILGYEGTLERQNIPPAYSPNTLDF